jgi:hypothetical protein
LKAMPVGCIVIARCDTKLSRLPMTIMAITIQPLITFKTGEQ